jgi:hypothetical protein
VFPLVVGGLVGLVSFAVGSAIVLRDSTYLNGLRALAR